MLWVPCLEAADLFHVTVFPRPCISFHDSYVIVLPCLGKLYSKKLENKSRHQVQSALYMLNALKNSWFILLPVVTANFVIVATEITQKNAFQFAPQVKYKSSSLYEDPVSYVRLQQSSRIFRFKLRMSWRILHKWQTHYHSTFTILTSYFYTNSFWNYIYCSAKPLQLRLLPCPATFLPLNYMILTSPYLQLTS